MDKKRQLRVLSECHDAQGIASAALRVHVMPALKYTQGTRSAQHPACQLGVEARSYSGEPHMARLVIDKQELVSVWLLTATGFAGEHVQSVAWLVTLGGGTGGRCAPLDVGRFMARRAGAVQDQHAAKACALEPRVEPARADGHTGREATCRRKGG